MTLLVRVRELHQRIAPFVLLPLFVTVCSGVGYRLARDWFGASRDQVHWLMTLHEGEWLGPTLEPVVVLMNAVGLLWMLITGLALLIERWRRQVH
ncbi:PepSY domain-containing protein [bacterium]|nr:PepSY domain-containing protein [Synechococcus sp. AH-601-O20]MDA7437019.1 PepSY domain-containing protein [Synechococcus sp. AH-601-P06]MDC0310427.1 PepSY domain-containing protein [bacterium]